MKQILNFLTGRTKKSEDRWTPGELKIKHSVPGPETKSFTAWAFELGVSRAWKGKCDAYHKHDLEQ